MRSFYPLPNSPPPPLPSLQQCPVLRIFLNLRKKERSRKEAGLRVTTGSKDVFCDARQPEAGQIWNRQDKLKGKRPQFPVDVRRLKMPLLKLPITNWNLSLKLRSYMYSWDSIKRLNGPNYNSALKLFFILKGQFLFRFLASSPSRSSSRSKSRPIWLEDETGKWTV